MRPFPFISALLLIYNAYGLQNITVDDTDPTIIYEGIWSPNSYQTSVLDFGGSHAVSVGDPSAIATFTFTGVAVYYMSPLWPFDIGVDIAVDFGGSEFINLRDFSSTAISDDSTESMPYQPVWGMSGLENAMHQVTVSVPPDGNFVVVDAFIYTIDDPLASSESLTLPAPTTSVSSTSSTLTSTTASSLTPSSATTSDSPSTPQSNSATGEISSTIATISAAPSQKVTSTNIPIPLFVGVLVGIIMFVISIIVVFWFCRRRRRRRAHLSDYWPNSNLNR